MVSGMSGTDGTDITSKADVVELFPTDDDAPVRSRESDVEEAVRFCRHLHVELDHEARRVYCRGCGREVPAFSYLATLAFDFERHSRSRDHAQREAERARRDLDDVKRQVRNAKSRLARAVDGDGDELILVVTPLESRWGWLVVRPDDRTVEQSRRFYETRSEAARKGLARLRAQGAALRSAS